jgi:hypothetical protein
MSVTAKEEMVADLQKRSPLQYELITTKPLGSVSTLLNNFPAGPIVSKPQIIHRPSSAELGDVSMSDGIVERRGFTLYVFPSPQYRHQRMIIRSPLYGPWRAQPENDSTPISAALRAALPKDIATDGLSDWESNDQFNHEMSPSGYLMRAGRKAHRIPVLNGLAEVARLGPASRERHQRDKASPSDIPTIFGS